MMFPWKRRAEEEKVHRQAAERRLNDARADWPQVRVQAAVLRQEHDLNGWTNTIRTIFSSPPPGHKKR